MVGKALAASAVISCWCGDTEVPFENLEDLDRILAAKSQPPTEDERKCMEVFIKRWSSTAPGTSNVTEPDQNRPY